MREPKDSIQSRRLMERVTRYIPGFRGYLEKEYRRESDKLQRDWLADRLERSQRALESLSRPLADAGQIDILPQIHQIRLQVDRLIGRIRGAVQGDSSFFDLVRVREDLLDRVYQHDLGLMREVDAVSEAVEALPGQHDRIAASLPALLEQIDALQTEWDAREDLFKGLE